MLHHFDIHFSLKYGANTENISFLGLMYNCKKHKLRTKQRSELIVRNFMGNNMHQDKQFLYKKTVFINLFSQKYRICLSKLTSDFFYHNINNSKDTLIIILNRLTLLSVK